MQQGFSGVDALSEGSWMTLEDGSQLWTWTLMSADAPSHMLLFEYVPLHLHASFMPSRLRKGYSPQHSRG